MAHSIPAIVVGSLWLLGILIGIAVADPRLIAWALAVLAMFALINVFLARMIFARVERWLAQRRTREILGVVFLLFMLGLQLIGPLMGRYGEPAKPAVMRLGEEVSPAQRWLPPGLAANAIARMVNGGLSASLGSLALLCVYAGGFWWVLNLQLHAQYLGENLSEAGGCTASRKQTQGLCRGWDVFGLPGAAAAIFEKELRYLARSGPMLFTLIMPVFMLLIFRLSGPHSGRSGNPLGNTDLGFPMGAAYSLLMLTNLIYNNFGADGGGIQFLFASPVRFREIVLAKNLAHMAVFVLEMVLVWLAVDLMYQPPAMDIAMATLAGILFAAPVNLAAGNLLSIYSPKKVEYSTFGRQRASQVVTGIYWEKGTFEDKPYARRGRFTDMWVKQKGGWQCVASQSTLIR